MTPDVDLIDWGHPVARNAPLNRELVSWHVALPSRTGGNIWRDLVKQNHGTLTSLTPSTVWGKATHTGGSGSLATDGTSGHYVDCGTPAGLSGATQVVYSGWIYRSGTGVTVGFGASGGPSSGAGSNQRLSLIWFSDGNIYITTCGGDSYAVTALSGTGWHHVLVRFNGAGSTDAAKFAIWIDGLPKTLSFTFVPGTSVPSGSGPWTIGRDCSNRYAAGSYDDIRLHILSGTPPDAWCAAQYRESLLGHPNNFRRIRTDVYVPAAGGAVAYPWHYYQQMMAG